MAVVESNNNFSNALNCHWLGRNLVLLAFVLVWASWAAAQLTTGILTGTVTDQSGAAVPGARVTVKNLETGMARSTVTGPRGRYEVSSLQVGEYEVTVSMPGFQTSVRTGIELTVGRTAVVDHTLQVGEVAQTVTITGEAPMIETTSATVTQLVDEKRVEDLPLNNRDLTQLTFLQPGVLKVPRARGGVFSGMGDTMTVAGARGTQNLFLLDGVSNSDLSNNAQGASGSYIGAETVKEFQIVTNNYSAEYQSAAGAIVSAVTKSGTNTLHGSAFWTLRNDNLDAARWEDNAFGGGVKPEFKRNQFGGSLGGPIARDRTFFFASYEGTRERQASTQTARVPSADAHRGILPDRTVTGDPVIKPYLELYPIPGQGNILDRDFGDGTARIAGTKREPSNDDFVAGKLDHQFAGEKAGFLTATYNWNEGDRSPFGILGDLTENGDAAGNGSTSLKHTLSVGHTSVLSPSTINEFKFGFSSSEIFGDVPLSDRDLSALAFHPNRKRMGQLDPEPDVIDAIGFRVDFSRYKQTTLQFKDGLSFTRGNHSFRTGVEIKRFKYLQNSCSRGCNGIFEFRDLRRFLINEPRRFDIFIPGHESPVRNLRQLLFGTYFQDNWQVLPSLTLNLGLRYEFTTVPDEDNHLISNLVNFTDNNVSVTTQVQQQFPDEKFAGTVEEFFKNPSLKSFSPRVGFAWAPGDRKTSIRGGFGVFYEYPMLYSIRTSLQELPPFVLSGRLSSGDEAKFGVPPLKLQPLAVNLYQAGLVGRPNIRYMEFEQKNTYIYRWSLTLQRELSGDWFVSAGYTGSRGLHLLHQSISNLRKWVGWPEQPTGPKQWTRRAPLINPNFGEVRTQSTNANSFYHGLAVSAQKRFSQGLQLQASYNFSKAIDQGSGVTSGGDELLQDQRGVYYWDTHLKQGLSQFDIRNSLSLNFSYELPGQELSGAAGVVGKGWQINGIITLSDGSPLTVLDENRDQRDYIGDEEYLRADLIPGGNNNPVLGGPDRYYDVSQFAPAPLGSFGNVGRNTLTGPGLATVDFSVLKNFQMTENHRIQFRAEFFNLFNRPNFGVPDMDPFLVGGARDANAGRITDTRSSARQIQFGLRYIF